MNWSWAYTYVHSRFSQWHNNWLQDVLATLAFVNCKQNKHSHTRIVPIVRSRQRPTWLKRPAVNCYDWICYTYICLRSIYYREWTQAQCTRVSLVPLLYNRDYLQSFRTDCPKYIIHFMHDIRIRIQFMTNGSNHWILRWATCTSSPSAYTIYLWLTWLAFSAKLSRLYLATQAFTALI